jgi:acyl carrier protein
MNNTQAEVIACIADQTGHDPEHINLSDTLHSLEMDEIDRCELAMMIEDHFNIVIVDADAEKWRSVQDVINFIVKVLI